MGREGELVRRMQGRGEGEKGRGLVVKDNRGPSCLKHTRSVSITVLVVTLCTLTF